MDLGPLVIGEVNVIDRVQDSVIINVETQGNYDDIVAALRLAVDGIRPSLVHLSSLTDVQAAVEREVVQTGSRSTETACTCNICIPHSYEDPRLFWCSWSCVCRRCLTQDVMLNSHDYRLRGTVRPQWWLDL